MFSGAPEDNYVLAQKEALEYLYDTVEGVVCPVATVAMWHDGKQLFLSDERSDFAKHGGSFLLLLSDPSVDLAAYWQQQYTLSNDELMLINELGRFVHSDTPVSLPKQYVKMLSKAKGLHEGLDSLHELGITVRLNGSLF